MFYRLTLWYYLIKYHSMQKHPTEYYPYKNMQCKDGILLDTFALNTISLDSITMSIGRTLIFILQNNAKSYSGTFGIFCDRYEYQIATFESFIKYCRFLNTSKQFCCTLYVHPPDHRDRTTAIHILHVQSKYIYTTRSWL